MPQVRPAASQGVVMFEYGTKVKLVGQTRKVYTVESNELRDGLIFYRLCEIRGGLFLASSLERVDHGLTS